MVSQAENQAATAEPVPIVVLHDDGRGQVTMDTNEVQLDSRGRLIRSTLVGMRAYEGRFEQDASVPQSDAGERLLRFVPGHADALLESTALVVVVDAERQPVRMLVWRRYTGF